ncbi:hypothetical protein [Allomuricauda sp. d1]|uniref:hypothetical protein n=1 Tax=Allomuricauda sp. d1 TaxID=3136725 RepID=UPI0031E2CB06
MKKSIYLFFVFIFAAFTMASTSSCRDDKAKNEVEEVGEDIEEGAEEVGESIEEGAEEVEEEVEDATDDH